MTVATLKAYTLKDLAKMARQRGVQGWHSMRKDQLVRALAAKARAILARSLSVYALRVATVIKRMDLQAVAGRSARA